MRVLIVEDEVVVSLLVEEMVETLGHKVVGPCQCVSDALLFLDQCEVALLDIYLGGELSYPVADALLERGIPFIFSSGYEDTEHTYDGVRTLVKPFNTNMLEQELNLIMVPHLQIP